MSLYVLSDLHLSFGVNKPMDVFRGWENHTERIRANWNRLVTKNDTVVLAGDTSWALKLEETKKDFEFTIVGSKESDILKGKMSSTAPVGEAIIGHKEGETVMVELPNGNEARYKIKSISYPRKRTTKKK